MIAVAGGGAQFLARGMARRPMGGVSTLETRERPVEGHVEGEEGGGREGGRGRGQRITDECAVRIPYAFQSMCGHWRMCVHIIPGIIY